MTFFTNLDLISCSVKDAAARTGVSVWTIRRWVHAGKVTTYRVGNRKLLVDLADLKRLLRANKVAQETI